MQIERAALEVDLYELDNRRQDDFKGISKGGPTEEKFNLILHFRTIAVKMSPMACELSKSLNVRNSSKDRFSARGITEGILVHSLWSPGQFEQ